MSLNSYISKQFSNPEDFGGSIVSLIMNRQNRPLYEETIRLLHLSDSDKVLDIGCGNGYVLNLLAKQGRESEFTGIDISGNIIKAAAKRNRRYIENGKMSFSCKNASSMSFCDASFSKAYTINTVYFWDDLAATMAEIFRVLKGRGIFINTLYSNETLSKLPHTEFGYRMYTAGQLEKAGADAGFEVKMVPLLQGKAYSFVYQRKEVN